jgi:hypothetical protein
MLASSQILPIRSSRASSCACARTWRRTSSRSLTQGRRADSAPRRPLGNALSATAASVWLLRSRRPLRVHFGHAGAAYPTHWGEGAASGERSGADAPRGEQTARIVRDGLAVAT